MENGPNGRGEPPFASPLPLLGSLQRLLAPEAAPEEFYAANIPLLARHGVHAFAAHELLSSNIPLPRPVEDAARKAVYEAQALFLVYRRTLIDAAEVFNRAGIPYAVLKGASLWPFYPASHLRFQEDIDILVHDRRLEEAAAAVKEKWRVSAEEENPFHRAFRLGPGLPALEIHTATGPKGKNRFSSREILDTVESLPVEDVSIPVPPFPLRLLLACAHAANHYLVTRIQWLNDVRLLVEYGNDVSFLSDLRGIRRRSCALTFLYAYRLFGSPALKKALDGTAVSPLFLGLVSRIVPLVFPRNPVHESLIRKTLYNGLLIQNPFSLL